MKKYKYLLLLVIAVLLVPKVALAEETTLPTTGVHYFLTYPNGEQVVTASYEEASNPEEKLIYTGQTNANGEVVLEGFSDTGELRIVQKVPTGYSTETEEITLDLSQARSVEFIDSKGVNPETGQSIIFIVSAVAIILVAAFFVVKGYKKQAVFLVPILVLSALAWKVYAANDDLVIVIKDKSGNKLSGVVVEIYAKPVDTYAAPAVKFSANGGHFFDGRTEMYYELPSFSCTDSEFIDFLGDKANLLYSNIDGAYREGYDFPLEYNPIPTQLTNDTVVELEWVSDPNASYVTIHGNGGVYPFGEKRLSNIVVGSSEIDNYANGFVNGQKHFVGYDDNASCSHFTANGISNQESSLNAKEVYACWNDKPDGMYVNGEAFVGTAENCYGKSSEEIELDKFRIYSVELGENLLFVDTNEDVRFKAGSASIWTFEIIYQGQSFVSLSSDDMTVDAEGYMNVTNEEKKNLIVDYLELLYNNDCINIGSSGSGK